MVQRILEISLPEGKSAFLWGARKIGKSTLLKNYFPQSTRFDFLQSDVFLNFLKKPSLLRDQIDALLDLGLLQQPVILDEVQKVPAILDEIHWLIENRKISFILCGSSARKLKHGHANLLGGRAWRYTLHPLVSAEIPDFKLLRALKHGLIPDHYFEANPIKSLHGYIIDYLKEEIMAEGLTRNFPAFSRFTDILGFSNGEMINYSNIARDCGVDSKTVREYFQILIDTNIGFLLTPFSDRRKRNTINQVPKFYLFDTGVANYLSKRTIQAEKGPDFGRSLEHFIFMELTAYNDYLDKKSQLHYWRTVQQQEVDFIVNDAEIAIEVKGSDRIDNTDLKNMLSFNDIYKPKKMIVVSNEKSIRKSQNVTVFPWRLFLEHLWQGSIY